MWRFPALVVCGLCGVAACAVDTEPAPAPPRLSSLFVSLPTSPPFDPDGLDYVARIEGSRTGFTLLAEPALAAHEVVVTTEGAVQESTWAGNGGWFAVGRAPLVVSIAVGDDDATTTYVVTVHRE